MQTPAGLRRLSLNNCEENTELAHARGYEAGNAVRTARYNAASFIPKTLYTFFSVIGHMYFAVVSVLQMFAPQNPESNRFTTAGPLLGVYFISALKQGIEDWKRHRADRKMNRRRAHVVTPTGAVEERTWQAIRPGDTIIVRNNEEFPADVMLLASSEEESRCFTETANLDGETNLKRRHCTRETAERAGMWRPGMQPLVEENVVALVSKMRGWIEYEQPNARLYNFTGTLTLTRASVSEFAAPESTLGEEVGVSAQEVVLRGCVLRNTRFVVGMVLFTGHETKVMQNMRDVPVKRSNVYAIVNRCIFLIFASQFVLMVISTVCFGVQNDNGEKHTYVDAKPVSTLDVIASLITFFILYNNLVPISLYMSMDVIKVLQAWRMETDPEMVHYPDGAAAIAAASAGADLDDDGGVSARARTSDLNEDLGQVEYVFSDKTGTLTRNVMEFRKCSINGVAYGYGTTEIGRAAAAAHAAGQADAPPGFGAGGPGWHINPIINLNPVAQDRVREYSKSVAGSGTGMRQHVRPESPAPSHRSLVGTSPLLHPGSAPASPSGSPSPGRPSVSSNEVAGVPDAEAAQVHRDKDIHFDDPRLLQEVVSRSPQGNAVERFLTLLSVCHTVIPERQADGKVAFRAASPDEEALVKAARCLGYTLAAAGPRMQVDVQRRNSTSTEGRKYEVVAVNEFSSARKRMSVLVRTGAGYMLYTKGADNVMFEISKPEHNNHARLRQHLTSFASEGLRTLVCADRVVPAGEATAWLAQYRAAATSHENRDDLLAAAAQKIERNMTIVGATAIEDKLQEGVPKAIASLRSAGIRVWVLTGDKQETAINIGYACQLLRHDTQLLVLDADTAGAAREQLHHRWASDAVRMARRGKSCTDRLALVVEGKALLHLLGDQTSTSRRRQNGDDPASEEERVAATAKSQLLELARICQCVVACRVSPKQKAAIVNLIRDNLSPCPITLAIGDGANDVNMIQTAHVGIGINGQEGVQAVNASDYAIAQFRFLTDLLLVHGRSNYRRISGLILYSFYKNLALVFTLFLFNFDNALSGSTFYDSIIKLSWNVFLALPIIAFGVLDTDVSDKIARKYPKLYKEGPKNVHLNVAAFAKWIGLGLIHGAIVFYVPRASFISTWAPSGVTDGLMVAGTTVYSALFLTVNLKCCMMWHTWTRYHHVVIWGSVISYFLFIPVYSAVYANSPFFGVSGNMLARPTFYAWCLLLPIACILPDMLMVFYDNEISPSTARQIALSSRAGMKLVRTNSGASETPPASAEANKPRALSVADIRQSGFAFSSDVPFSEYQRRHRKEQ